MKKFFYFCALAAIAATALSCTKETAAPVKMKTISVELGCPQLDEVEAQDPTKTILVDHKHVYWTSADVNIFAISTEGDFYLLTSTDKTQAASKKFTGTIPEGKEILYYYYDRNRTSKGVTWKGNGLLRQSLDNSQSVNANSFHAGCNYAIARPGDTAFHNFLGYIKWTNNGSAIKSVRIATIEEKTFQDGGTEFFTGYFDVKYTSEYSSPNCSKYNYSTVALGGAAPYVNSVISASAIPEDQSYYAIVIPGDFFGVKLTITLAEGGSFTIKSNKFFSIESGKVIDLGVLPVAPVSKAGVGQTILPGSGDFTEGWILE